VSNLDKSIAFYNKAFGLIEKKRKVAADGSFIIAYLGDDKTNFLLELTWLRNHPHKIRPWRM
jgi:lactoylglutathione lyase